MDGVGYIPEDRHEMGLLLSAPLWENAMLGHQNKEPFSHGWWIDKAGARARTEEMIKEYRVAAPSADVSAVALSGGNQQKFIVAREMTAKPNLLIASQPTRGVDVGAQGAVWEAIREARGAGMALLLVSADLEELIGLSDTLFVIYSGRLVAKLDPGKVTPEELGSYMTGARRAEGDGAATATGAGDTGGAAEGGAAPEAGDAPPVDAELEEETPPGEAPL
jgi:simple sugar transport system ATP-binding protein